MTEHKNMTISEVDEVLKEYTKEFVAGEENWYVFITPEGYCTNFKTYVDSSKIVYFESEEKIEDLKEFLGVDNFVYYFSHIYKDLHLDYTLFLNSKFIKKFRNVCDTFDKFKLDYYDYKGEDNFSFWYIVPEKVSDYYKITYKRTNSFKDLGVIDRYYIFESLEKAQKAVKELGEYNILHCLFFIKGEFLEKDAKVFEDTTPQKDMTISEIEEVLKEYTCEFVHLGENYYIDCQVIDVIYIFRTCYDYTQKFYFISEEKANDFLKKIGDNNIKKFLNFLREDLIEEEDVFKPDFYKKHEVIKDEIKYYSLEENKDKSSAYIIRPFKENGKYAIEYIWTDNPIDKRKEDFYFSSYERAKNAVKEIGEYNILHYYFFIKDTVLKESNTTQQNDMVKKPSHYQGKNGLEVYEVLENFLEDVESYYLGNVIKYILRYKNKNGLEDLKKAREYLNKMIERENDGE